MALLSVCRALFECIHRTILSVNQQEQGQVCLCERERERKRERESERERERELGEGGGGGGRGRCEGPVVGRAGSTGGGAQECAGGH